MNVICFIEVYVEFGAVAGDTITLTNTLTTGTYNWNILVRQIACNSPWRKVLVGSNDEIKIAM